MNAKGNSNRIHSSIYRLFVAIVLIAMFVPVGLAGEAEEHNPYTIYGLRLRSHLIPETPGATDELGPLVFQEIVPCRFVNTLEEARYDNPWGGKEFHIHETRTYYPKGELVSSNGWVNPCTKHVPIDAVAVSLRLNAYAPENGTNMYLAPASAHTLSQPGIFFASGRNEMQEANVVLRNNGFAMTTDQETHLTIDIIGYFLRDPYGAGARGEKGDKGERGDRGEAGAQGERGEKGERGEAGAQGLEGDKGDDGQAGAQGLQGAKGDKGDTGEAGAQGLQGLKGDKGDQGEAGAQGLKGDKGDQGERGETGAQGLKGDKGDQGEAGAQGLKGDKGDQGDRGETGAQGLKGDKGDKGDRGEAGAQGLKGDKGDKGDRGEAGAQGLKGDKGDKGDRGETGAKGNTGATGPQGPAGPQGPVGPQGPKGDTCKLPFEARSGGPYTFPPGGTLKIYDGFVNANSFIIPVYVEVSNGNAIGITSVSKGSFVATGSPNKPFKYIVINLP